MGYLLDYDFSGPVLVIGATLQGIPLALIHVLGYDMNHTVLIRARHAPAIHEAFPQLLYGASTLLADSEFHVGLHEHVVLPDVLVPHVVEPVLMVHADKASVLGAKARRDHNGALRANGPVIVKLVGEFTATRVRSPCCLLPVGHLLNHHFPSTLY